MESAVLGVILDSSVIIDAERKGQTVEDLLEHIRQSAGEVEIAICAVTVAELVHGIYRANTPERSQKSRCMSITINTVLLDVIGSPLCATAMRLNSSHWMRSRRAPRRRRRCCDDA